MTGARWLALKAAFPYTLPIFASFWFLGMTYGVYMHALGFSWLYPALMSLTIFGGSLEFVAASMLLSPFAPVQTLLVALLIQSRHLFYGLSMLDKYRGLGWKKLYLIFGLCDETFALNYSLTVPARVDRGWFMFWVTALDHFYWFSGATLGGVLGSLVSFDLRGVEFAMTAMFLVIFLDLWRTEPCHVPAFIGLGGGVACLAVFGADRFLLPTMGVIVAALTLLRPQLERAGVAP